jgi:hypothetical protein
MFYIVTGGFRFPQDVREQRVPMGGPYLQSLRPWVTLTGHIDLRIRPDTCGTTGPGGIVCFDVRMQLKWRREEKLKKRVD